MNHKCGLYISGCWIKRFLDEQISTVGFAWDEEKWLEEQCGWINEVAVCRGSAALRKPRNHFDILCSVVCVK